MAAWRRKFKNCKKESKDFKRRLMNLKMKEIERLWTIKELLKRIEKSISKRSVKLSRNVKNLKIEDLQ